MRSVDSAELGDGWLRITRAADGLRWAIRGLGRFSVSRDGAEVRYDLEPDCNLADAEQALIGPILGAALQLRDASLLHACGVVVGDRAIAMSAPSGFGKSTLAAALLRHGARLLSDDTLPLRPAADGYLAVPYLPRLKLWPESLDAFGRAEDGYEPVISWASKRHIAVGNDWGQSSSEPAPLAAIYMLAPTIEQRAPAIEALGSVDGVLNLQSALYQPDLLDAEQSARALRHMARVAERVPVRRLHYRRGFDALDDVCAALLADIEELDEAGRP